MISLLTAFFMAYADAPWYWWLWWVVVFFGRTAGQIFRIYIRRL
jgi:hypothetical protein